MQEISNMILITFEQALSMGGLAFGATQLLKKKFKLSNKAMIHTLSTIIGAWFYVSFRINSDLIREVNSLLLVIAISNGVHLGYKKLTQSAINKERGV